MEGLMTMSPLDRKSVISLGNLGYEGWICDWKS